jgi:hypothetical protein
MTGTLKLIPVKAFRTRCPAAQNKIEIPIPVNVRQGSQAIVPLSTRFSGQASVNEMMGEFEIRGRK